MTRCQNEGTRQANSSLLIQPQNLETAYDVLEQMPAVQDKLISKFWDTLENQVQTKIDAKRFETYREGKSTEANAQIGIYERGDDGTGLQCHFKVQQGSGRLPVFFGICWSRRVSKDEFAALMSNGAVKPTLSEFVRLLEEAGFKRDNWWIAYKYLDNEAGLRDRSQAIRLASGNDLEDRVAAELFGFMEEQLVPLHELNGTLAKAKVT